MPRGSRAGTGDARPSPFAPVAPVAGIAVVYALATAAWIGAGDHLPGGRWLAVHLFTLGVVSNAVLAFSQHFGRTVTRSAAARWRWQPAAMNAGVVLVLIGIPGGTLWATAAGATIVTAVVLDGHRRLRRMRRQAVGARFAWIARVYERAHGSFIHGAVLGLLLGAGLLRGPWYAAGRLAHLHVNVLGWAGLTLLATLVFFGPTVIRARIEEGADARAANALRRGATGLTLAMVALLASGIGGAAGTGLRLLAAGGLGVYAWAVGVVCLPVLRVAWSAKPYAARWPVISLCAWFVVVVWTDVAVMAAGRWELLDAVGLAALAGVLGQALATTLAYIAPVLRGRSSEARAVIVRRLESGVAVRTMAYNAGVVAVVTAAALPVGPATTAPHVATAGWALIAAITGAQLAAGLWPVRGAVARAALHRSR